jgi:hypothetical protein
MTRDKATFDLSFESPLDYTFIAVGELLSEEIGSSRISRWISREPIRNASFNIGAFREFALGDTSMADVRLFMNIHGHRYVATMEDEVRHDIGESLRFFTHLFGTPRSRRLDVSEIPYLHGEAFPGLLHLSWLTYEPSAFLEFIVPASLLPESHIQFRAHEVAHQWWGVGVDFASYHDQWLSEGFAEYSGLWYTQMALNDNNRFFEILDDWKEKILTARRFVFGSGQESGPIWLGYRTQGSETRGDYALIIYKKGAWVLHMLRGLLLDLKSMNDDRFGAMLREFYHTYEGKRASTDDFRRVVETHAGEDMRWFFDQWVYGTSIPTYRYATRTEIQADGKYDLLVKVTVDGVPASFRMPVIVSVVLADGRTARMRLAVSKDKTEFNIPGLPEEPESFIFNDLNSVLCEVEEVDW